jgi:hypothetical protein
MPTTANKGYSVPTTGTESGTWGVDINANSFGVIDTNLGGITSVALSNVPVTLSAAQAQNLILRLTGTLTANVQVTTPCLGVTMVENATTGAFTVTLANGFGTPAFCPGGHRTIVITDGANGPRVMGSSQVEDLATTGVIRRQSTGYLITDTVPTTILFEKDYNGNVVTTGIQGEVYVSFPCTITANTLFADVSGSLVVDIWKSAFGVYPPTVANTICSATPPTLASQLIVQNTTLTGWTTSIAAGDILRFNVNSAATVTRYTLALSVTRY